MPVTKDRGIRDCVTVKLHGND